LTRHSLLQRSDQAPPAAEQALEAWRPWNPAAGFFHLSTKDVPYTHDSDEVERFLRRQAQKWPLPAPLKHYARARQFPLPPPQRKGEFARVLLARRTWRRFAPRPVTLAALGTLLGLTWGVQDWVKAPGLGRLPLKTSPSGGARHPIEAYVVSLRVAGLPRGLYHYAADTHHLELLHRGTTRPQVTRWLANQYWFGSAAAVVLMTAVFPRVQWKYPHARAYRVVLLDAGHLCQTFCLVATWLGLAPFCTAALADTRIEKALGIDGVTESVLYVAGVGALRPGQPWTPWPERHPALPSRKKL
ncbi:MAG: SagB family peptide dehydrogenase, partial [Candidatus Acidiferrales bacterium]